MSCKPSRTLPRRRSGATWPALLAAALAALIAGCGRSPNTQFFTLAAVRPDSARDAFAGAPVQVRAVHIPALLDRPERVLGRSRERLDILETQQWATPLDDMIRLVLTQDLSARLPAGMVVAANAPEPPGTHGVVVDVAQFRPNVGGEVVLDASWTVLGVSPRRTRTRTPDEQQPMMRAHRRWRLHSGAGADAQVGAMSTLLGRLADAIAASVRSAAS